MSKTCATAAATAPCPCVPPYQSTPISALKRAGSRGPGGPPRCVVNKAAASIHCICFTIAAPDTWTVFGAEQQKNAPTTCSTGSVAPLARKPAATPRTAKCAVKTVWTAASVQLVGSSALISPSPRQSSLELRYDYLNASPQGRCLMTLGPEAAFPRANAPAYTTESCITPGNRTQGRVKTGKPFVVKCRAWMCI